ncbi:hypothetical protein CCMA1212_002077 [Trichoderma ghanense]|uniref:Uncharacterized protein n=1 Tax=Trichoderma ghanense TaxID=65468 RepID=A0ABY2HFU8_9HYPO
MPLPFQPAHESAERPHQRRSSGHKGQKRDRAPEGGHQGIKEKRMPAKRCQEGSRTRRAEEEEVRALYEAGGGGWTVGGSGWVLLGRKVELSGEERRFAARVSGLSSLFSVVLSLSLGLVSTQQRANRLCLSVVAQVRADVESKARERVQEAEKMEGSWDRGSLITKRTKRGGPGDRALLMPADWGGSQVMARAGGWAAASKVPGTSAVQRWSSAQLPRSVRAPPAEEPISGGASGTCSQAGRVVCGSAGRSGARYRYIHGCTPTIRPAATALEVKGETGGIKRHRMSLSLAPLCRLGSRFVVVQTRLVVKAHPSSFCLEKKNQKKIETKKQSMPYLYAAWPMNALRNTGAHNVLATIPAVAPIYGAQRQGLLLLSLSMSARFSQSLIEDHC